MIGSRYTVLEELGRGGSAIVYRARDTKRSSDLALKRLVTAGDAENQRRLRTLFEREFYVLAQLSHPSIVEVFDFGTDASGPFYTMELLDGGDLTARPPSTFRGVCELGVQICSALALLHSRRYVHRDLSPRNVHHTSDGRAKLIDFGALVNMGPSRQVVGTPAFIAPESILGTMLDARTDLFSLGATLYYTLTGRPPFEVSTFEELRRAWRTKPPPPSQLVDGIPPELDSLLLSMLRVEAEFRPRNAFEVMQRLAAIAGIARPEAGDFSQAYLHAPTLVGREPELQRFRSSMRHAIAGRGSGLWLEGAAGVGRSRLLEAFVLEAKTQGMLTARARRIPAKRPCGVAYDLAEQLVEASGMGPTTELAGAPDKLSSAITALIQAVTCTQPVLITVDDAEQVDDASLGVLAALAHGATHRALVVVVGVTTPRAAGASPALDVVASHCQRLRLRELTKAEFESLFSSVFGLVPNVALVSDRIAEIAMGNPSAAMTVAQHMVDKQWIRYAEGSWHLPADLTLTELPATAKELLRARVASLPPLACRIAELQALAVAGYLSRADHAELLGPEGAAELDSALDILVQRGVLSNDGDTYVLPHGVDRALLLAGVTEERSVQHHAALARHFASSLPEVPHLLMAGETERALGRLMVEIASMPEGAGSTLSFPFRMSQADIAVTLEEALRRAIASARPLREQHEIARCLVTLSVIADNELHARHADFWRARLELDSGLVDFRSLDATLPAVERLQRALAAAAARNASAPERERVYRVDEAIRLLARYVAISIAIGARTRDAALMHSISELLEPFAPLSPLLHALWQNAVSAYDLAFRGCVERGRERALAVYERLGQLKGDDQDYANVIRNAVASTLALIDTVFGLESAERWLGEIEADPLQSVNAMYIRRISCIVEGDRMRAEYYRMRAEILALQSSRRQMFTPPLRNELGAHYRMGDLASTKQVAEQMARLAEDAPGWKPQHYLAQGYYQRLRGDLASAQAAFEHAMQAALAAPQELLRDRLSWVAACAGHVSVLTARGQAREACRIGRAALAECETLGIHRAASDLIRDLAVAEAKVGEHTRAGERLDALIELRREASEVHRVIDYEARVRVAIESGEYDVVRRYLERLDEYARGSAARPQYMQLFEEARRVGVTLDMPLTARDTTAYSR
ncbi:MAG TPA: protein kinase [Polyangiales bacterium]|nr:protein kinase [Polyangiales bacterium]